MKKVKYLLFSIALLFVSIFTVNALDASEISVENNNASFSKIYAKLEEANQSISDFEKFVSDNNGIVLSTKTDKIINEINTEILNGILEGNSISELDNAYSELNDYYNNLATEDVSYNVYVDEVEEVTVENISYEHEDGKVGEYNSYVAAYVVSRMVEAYENRDDYEFRTHIERERRIINTIIANLNGNFDNEFQRNFFIAGFALAGYDLSDVNFSEGIVTDTTNETKEFSSLDERDNYINSLINDGYRVSHELTSIYFNEVEEDYTTIDEDFDSISDLNDYIRTIDQNYNHKDVNITDNSYDEITDEVRTQDGFETESEARDYIDSLKGEYRVFNDKITSYTDTYNNVVEDTKYYTSETAAQNALNTLTESEDIISSNIRKLSLDEINMDDVFAKGDTGLNSSNRTFGYLSADLTTKINVGNRVENATIVINSVTINGRAYRLLNTENIPNNSKVVVNGTINYCNRGGLFGTLCIPASVRFTSEGILNSNNNESITQNLFFQYAISRATLNSDGSVTLYDNLEDIYKLDYSKNEEVTKTLYKAEANIYGVKRINKYNLSGYASNIVKYPVLVVDIVKEKDRTIYKVEGQARYNIYRDFYVLYYDATRTVRQNVTTYKQNYRVVENTKDIKYKAEGTAKLNANEIKAPNTGVNNSNNNSLLILLLLPLVILIERKIEKLILR